MESSILRLQFALQSTDFTKPFCAATCVLALSTLISLIICFYELKKHSYWSTEFNSSLKLLAYFAAFTMLFFAATVATGS